MSDTAASIRHYASEDLISRMMAALAAAGHDVSKPTVETLYLIDQLHGGGLNSTKAQAALIPLGKETRVLDAGCGIGGAKARTDVQGVGHDRRARRRQDDDRQCHPADTRSEGRETSALRTDRPRGQAHERGNRL